MTLAKLIEEMRAGLAKATQGEWRSFFKQKYNEWHVSVQHSGSMRLALFEDGCPTGQHDAEHIARCSPDNIRAILSRIEELEKALEPFAAMIKRLDGDAIAMLRAQQPEAVITDEELAELHLPSKQVMITDGVMAFGRSDPRPDKTVVTAGHLRTARRAIEGWDNAER